MSLSIDEEAFDVGLGVIHDRLVDAVDSYYSFLVTYGTCPDVSLSIELKVMVDKILSHDRHEQGECNAFRRYAVEEEKVN